jgi:ankyrin repeat protein
MTGKLLISQRADLAARDLNGDTPLHMAAANGSSEMVKLLLDHSARPTAPNKDGETALHMCARYALGNMDVARSLVASGADLNIVDARNQTLLHHLVVNRRFGNKELYFLHFFLTMGLDADARDNQVPSPQTLNPSPEPEALNPTPYTLHPTP